MTVAQQAGRLAGIVLAAGASTRLGTPKQLLQHEGASFVAHTVRVALEVCDAEVVVVTGATGEAVARSLAGLQAERLRIVRNPDWSDGMGSSLAFGASEFAGHEPDAVLVLLCDQPRVTTGDLVSLIQLWQNSPFAPAVAGYAGSYGAPAVFPRAWLPRLVALSGEAGAKGLLADTAGLQILDMPRAALDIDTPADLDAWKLEHPAD